MKNINEKAKRVLALALVLLFALPLLCSCANRVIDETAVTPSSAEPGIDSATPAPTLLPYHLPSDPCYYVEHEYNLDKRDADARLIVIATATHIDYISHDSVVETSGSPYSLPHSVTTYRIEEIIKPDQTRKLKIGDEIEVVEDYYLVDSEIPNKYVYSLDYNIPTYEGRTYILLLEDCLITADVYKDAYATYSDSDGRFLLTESVRNAAIPNDQLTYEDCGIYPENPSGRLVAAKQARDKYMKYIFGE